MSGNEKNYAGKIYAVFGGASYGLYNRIRI